MTEPRRSGPPDPRPRNLPLPGMAAISLWMLTLSSLGVIGVLTHRYPASASRIVILILSTFFAFAGLGLMRKYRWGWALALGAAVLCMSFGFYSLFHSHQAQWVVMALVNLIFFLYLIRPEVRQRLR
jgi:uncharacterized membrane protein (DUF2068 family)